MSFASQAREEIARRSLQKDCCVRAAAYGIACFAKYFDASGLVLQTEQELTTQVASHRHRDEPADRPQTDSLPDVRQRVHRGSFFVQRHGH